MNRAEHLQWAKDRAMEYANQGDTTTALASLTSDLRKHPDLATHAGIELGTMLAMGGHLKTPAQMREWIEGCN